MDHTIDHRQLERLGRLLVEKKKILGMAPEKALAHILDAPQPVALVHAFAEADLHLLIREIGPDEALPLLALASDRQIDYIFDMEIWHRDRLVPAAATRWLDRMLRAAPDRLARWALREDAAFIELYLFKNIEVIVRVHDQDPSDFAEGFVSFDETFYFRARHFPSAGGSDGDASKNDGAAEHAHREKILYGLLEQIAACDFLKYQQLLLELSAVLPAESEEALLRLRNVRLAEKGFLPFDEALGVYQPLDAQQLRFLHPISSQKRAATAQLPFRVPLIPLRLIQSGSLFARALRLVADETRLVELQAEYAGLCNRIVVADQIAVAGHHTLDAVSRKALGYITVGLEHLCVDAEAGRAAKLFSDYGLTQIFRVGYGRALALKQRADAWLRRSWFRAAGLGLAFWDQRWMGLLGGLLLKKPLYYDHLQVAEHYRDFMHNAEIRRTAAEVDRMIAFDELLGALDLPVKFQAANTLLTYKNLLLSAWARHDLGLSGSCTEPILRERFKIFFTGLFALPAGSEKIRPAAKTSFLNWLGNRSKMAAHEISERLAVPLEDLFAELEDEYGRLSADDLDPRFMPHFLLK